MVAHGRACRCVGIVWGCERMCVAPAREGLSLRLNNLWAVGQPRLLLLLPKHQPAPHFPLSQPPPGARLDNNAELDGSCHLARALDLAHRELPSPHRLRCAGGG